MIDAAYVAEQFGRTRMSYDTWQAISRVVEWLCEHWNQPDEGIWETRGGRQNYTYSRLMSWVAFERAIRIARQHGLPADLTRWMAARDCHSPPGPLAREGEGAGGKRTLRSGMRGWRQRRTRTSSRVARWPSSTHSWWTRRS